MKANLIDISGLVIYTANMDSLPSQIQQSLLRDAADRDLVTARRKCLLEILWEERYLTRAGLIARVEAVVRKGCFGGAAWEDTFYRDMRVVKDAFQAAGYQLAYSRTKHCPGYYLRKKEKISSKLIRVILGAIAEVDREQINISAKFEPWQRVQQGLSITDVANQVVAYRQKQRQAAHA